MKMIEVEEQFMASGAEISEHAVNRVLGRANRGVTVQNTLDAYQNGAAYFDKQENTNIHFLNGIAVSSNVKTGKIVNVQPL